MYNGCTKVKDLTVQDLKDIINECILGSSIYKTPLECIGKEFRYNSDIVGDIYSKGESSEN